MFSKNEAQGIATPASSLLTPDNCMFLFVDHQPQMFFSSTNRDSQELTNNVVGLAKTAKLFQVPTVISSIAADKISGHTIKQLTDVFPKEKVIDRTFINGWEDENLVRAVEKTGRHKIVLSGMWTEMCVAFPALSAREQGYEVYVVADACGSVNTEIHDAAIRRMEQAGCTTVTWMQVLLELQRDWSRLNTYQGTTDIIKEHAGSYGQSLYYHEQMA